MVVNSEYSYLRSKEVPNVPYATIPQMIWQYSQANSESVAHVFINAETFEKHYMTFENIYNSARRFARGLRKLGILKDDIVILGLDNVPEWMTATVGIQMCGAIPMLFHFDHKDGKDLTYVLEKVGDRGKAVIFNAGRNDRNIEIMKNIFKTGKERGQIIADSFPSCKWSILISNCPNDEYLSLDEVCEMGSIESKVPLPLICPENIAAIFLTSGSTGHPKLIPYSHSAVMLMGFHSVILHGVSSISVFNDRPFSWVEGFPYWEIYTGYPRSLITNLAATPSEEAYMKVLKAVLKGESFDSLIIIPDILHKLCQEENNTWRFPNLFLGGVPIPRELTKAASAKCDRLVVVYGSTEMAVVSCEVIKTDRNYLDYDVGRPVHDVEIKVADSDGTLLKRGTRGEVHIRTFQRFPGYMNDEENTKAVLTAGGWYKSGDSGFMTSEGHLIVDGRLSDSVIETSEGYLSVAIWEARLKEHTAVKDALVATFVDEHRFSRVCYAIVPVPGVNVTEAEIIGFLLDADNRSADLWDKILLPKNVVFFDSFPKTYNGKVSRKQVVEICKTKVAKG